MENPAEKIYDLIRYVASATRSSTSTSATSRAGSTIFVDVFSSHPRLAREYVVPVRMCPGRSTSRCLTDHGDAKRSSIVFIAAIAVGAESRIVGIPSESPQVGTVSVSCKNSNREL